MSNLNIQIVDEALRKSWSEETSNSDDWSINNPSLGQCAITACIVQDYLGGDIVNSVAMLPSGKYISHYLNLIDGEYIDITSKQFPAGTTFSEPMPKNKSFSSTRKYCLSYEDTNNRYKILKAKVAELVH